MSMRRFLRLTLLAISLAVLLVTVPIIIRGIRLAVNPSSHDVADAIIEYYRSDLRARLASGDHGAFDELVTRLEHGPLAPIGEYVARKVIQGLPPPQELGISEIADWIRSNKHRLEFDPKTRMFRLVSGSATRPSQQPP